MRIHTDLIYDNHLLRALDSTGLTTDGVWLETCDQHGSRSRARAFNVKLAATPRDGRRRRRNFATRLGDDVNTVAATYDEWGIWIRALFKVDPEAIIGQYKGVDDFHTQTHGRFREHPFALEHPSACPGCLPYEQGQAVS